MICKQSLSEAIMASRASGGRATDRLVRDFLYPIARQAVADLTRDPEEADELVQVAVIHLWSISDRVLLPGNPYSFLRTAAFRAARQRKRSEHTRKVREGQLRDGEGAPPECGA